MKHLFSLFLLLAMLSVSVGFPRNEVFAQQGTVYSGFSCGFDTVRLQSAVGAGSVSLSFSPETNPKNGVITFQGGYPQYSTNMNLFPGSTASGNTGGGTFGLVTFSGADDSIIELRGIDAATGFQLCIGTFAKSASAPAPATPPVKEVKPTPQKTVEPVNPSTSPEPKVTPTVPPVAPKAPEPVKTEEKKPEAAVTQPAKEVAPVVTEKDCSKIRADWLALKKKADAFNCDELQKKADQLQQQLAFLTDLLKQYESRVTTDRAALQKLRNQHQTLFRNGMTSNKNYSFDKPTDTKGWNYASYDRYGMQVWFKGDGKELLQFYKDWDAQIKEIEKNIEKEIINVRHTEQDLTRTTSVKSQIESELQKTMDAVVNCQKEKDALISQANALASANGDCLAKLQLQQKITSFAQDIRKQDARVQRDIAQATKQADKFDAFDKDIATLSSQVKTQPKECEGIVEQQNSAKTALSDARSARKIAQDDYDLAKESYKKGDLENADNELNNAKIALDRADKQVAEALKRINAAISTKQVCKNALQATARAEQHVGTVERQKQPDANGVEDDDEDYITKILQQGQGAITGNPYHITGQTRAISAAFPPIRQLYNDYIGIGCDCPSKALFAISSLFARTGATTVLRDIGIGVMKAPIDALSPASRAGKVVQWVASNALTTIGSDSLGDAAKAILQNEVLGAIMPKSGFGLTDKPAGQYANMAVSDILSGNGVKVWEVSGESYLHKTCGGTQCDIKAVIMYNPYTRKMLVIAKPACCSQTILLTIDLDENGIAIGTPTYKFLD